MNLEIQKQTGSFYTESKVAESLTNWAIRNRNDSVLEPSFGDGIFIEKSLRRFLELGNGDPSITAIEIQEDVVDKFIRQYQGKALITYSKDFLSLDFNQQFDVVIGNPPYVSIKRLPIELRETAQQIIKKNNVKCSNNGSLWYPFVLGAISALKKEGRLAYVLPFEITYARYACSLWSILAQNFSKLTVCRIYEDFFPNVDVETILLLADGKGGNTTKIDYNIYDSVDDLLRNYVSRHTDIQLQDVITRKKPFISSILTLAQQLLLERLKKGDMLKPISENCKFKIGYVSADKEFFHPSFDIVEHYLIPNENLYPTILNAKDVNGGTGIGIEVKSGECNSKLYIPRSITEGDKLYILSGEMKGVHQRYKCRQRNPWYITPNIEIPDVILSVFGERPKIIVNKGAYAVSNSLLCGCIKGGSAEQLLCRWYNSLTLLSIELNVHSLGGGSFVIIPGEADKLEIVASIPNDKVKSIYKELDECIIKAGVDAAYELGDKLVLQGIYNLSDSDISIIREAIQTLRSWRNPVKRRERDVIVDSYDSSFMAIS